MADGAGLGPEDHLYLVDGSGYIFRAYHALPPLTRKSDGLPVGAVSGFCNMLYKLLADLEGEDRPSHLGVIFDYSSKTFRNEIYPEYKAHRPPPPEDLRPQFGLIRQATRAFNVACIELEGYEADDVIATYAREGAEAGAEVTIVSSDKDLMQLVGGRVGMVDGMKNKVIGPDQVVEKFGVPADKVVDVQALAGDSVDNVPGAPGIGIKTAALLINEYGDLETLLSRAEEIKQPKRRQTLIDNAEQIRVSKRLVQLDNQTPGLPDVGSLAVDDARASDLIGFLKAMEFTTLTKRIATRMEADPVAIDKADLEVDWEPPEEVEAVAEAPDAPIADEGPIDPDAYECVSDEAALTRWIEEIYEIGAVAIDTETTSLNEMIAELVGVSLATRPGRACYIPLGHVEGDGDLLGEARRAEGQMDFEAALALLKPMLEDPSILKIGQNLKYDIKVLKRYGMSVAPIDDTMLISYALNSGVHGHGMDTLSKTYLDHAPIPIKELLGTGKSAITFDKVEVAKAVRYAAEDADVTLRLHRALKPRLPVQRLTTVYETLERPLIPVLARMEMAGIKVDRDTLSRLSNGFAQRMAGLEAEIHKLAGQPFNVASPKQLGEILFDQMGAEGGKKGKAGAYSTGADVLETLSAQSEDETVKNLASTVLDWRQLSKLKSTYTDALQEHINVETGRVHTSFSLAATSTGRLASTDPNLQNIPVRTEEGRRIREAFVAEEGNVLLSLDYSQIELRLLAHIAGIDALKQAFLDGQDIHAMTASEVFGVPVEGMDPMVRRQAKAINFGVIYGISAFGLSNNLHIPRGEAQAFIDAYFEKFPGIRKYMDATVEHAQKHGFVETIFGRRIHTPDINTKGPKQGFQKRAAINAPIQGSAADVIRRAMIRIPAALKREKLSARMLLQVHDELLFEVPEAEADAAIAAMREVMETSHKPAVEIDVPLVVDAGRGQSWAEAH